MNYDEKAHLENISTASLYAAGVNSDAIKYAFKIIERYIVGKRLLELGPAEGVMTELLATTGMQLTLVEGSRSFCDHLSNRFPEANVVNALFEEYEPDEQFDTIVLGHVLEHVEDPIKLLKNAKQWITPKNGHFFAAVPNARSLHRQAATIMGLLPQEDWLNEMDIHHGHRRVFNPESFRSLFSQAGLHIEVFGGYWLKPLSNSQIEESWSAAMIEAFMQMGERYPDIAGEIYVVASNRTNSG